MSDLLAPALNAFVPLFAFMLVPVWIPLLAITGGAIADRVAAARGRAPEPTPVDRLRERRAAEASESLPLAA